MGNYIFYPFLSKLCWKRGRDWGKNENEIYCRYFSAECLPTKFPLPNFVILKRCMINLICKDLKVGGFAVQENNVSSLTQTLGGKSVLSDNSQNYICIVIVQRFLNVWPVYRNQLGGKKPITTGTWRKAQLVDVLTCSPNILACASFPRTYISDLKGAFVCHITPWSFESVFANSCQPQALKSCESYPRPMYDDLPNMRTLFPDSFIFH